MKRQIILFIIGSILFLAVGTVIAQKITKTDSLRNVIHNAETDTTKIIALNWLSRAFVEVGNIDSAFIVAQEAKQMSEKINYKKGIGASYNNIGIALQRQGNLKEASLNYTAALKIRKEMGDKEGIAGCYINIGNVYAGTGDYTSCLENYFAALRITEEIGDKEGSGTLYCNIGTVYNWKGNYAEALKNFLVSLRIRNEIGDKFGVTGTYNNIGLVQFNLGNYPEAMKNYVASLKLAEETHNKDGIATSYVNIGLIYSTQKKYDKALQNFNIALKIETEIGDKNAIAQIHNSIGVNYYKQSNYSEALKSYTASLVNYEETGYKIGIAEDYNNIGLIYEHQGNSAEALKNYFLALKMRQEIGDDDGITNTYYNIGMINIVKLGKVKEGREWLEKSLTLAKKINKKTSIQDNYQGLSLADSSLGNFKSSLENFKLYTVYYDSLNNQENGEKIVRAEMQYDFEKKESIAKAEQEKQNAEKNAEIEKQKLIRNSVSGGAGIIVLSALFSFFFYKRKRDAEQKQKETLLSLQVSETEMKALRSQMNPHFIFNALQSIQTFLISNKSEDANLYLLKFSKLMRAVLENSQHSEVPLKEDMQALELYMQLESIRLAHPFTYQFHIDASVDTERDCLPPLILQPFVENAIWHGLQYKESPGHINIFISKKDNALYATVEDNGVGRDMSKQVTQPMLLKKESLGMKLTEERLKILNETKKIKAKFQIVDLFTHENKPAGTRVEFSLPMAS